MIKRYYARLGGMNLFGDVPSFSIAPLVNTPASRDAFLGYPAGTSTGPPGQMWGLAGAFYGASRAAVQASIDALAATAGVSGSFGWPTTDRFPDDFRWAPRPCYFLPSDFVPGSIASYPGNTWTAPYRLVIRST